MLFGMILKTIHVLLIVVWLGVDLAVFTLSFGSLDRTQPIAVRLDRARMAERFDFWVLKAFLLTTPLGLLLLRFRGYDLFATSWLSLKVAMMGVIFIIAVGVIAVAGAGGTTAALERIAEQPADVERLERELRDRVIRLAYPIWALYLTLIAMIFVALTKWIF